MVDAGPVTGAAGPPSARAGAGPGGTMTVKLAVAWRPCAPVTSTVYWPGGISPATELVALVDGVVEGAHLSSTNGRYRVRIPPRRSA